MAVHKSWTEITPEVARRLWETHSLFAYDETNKVSWQLNIDKKSCKCLIDKAVKGNALIFVENAWKNYEPSVRE